MEEGRKFRAHHILCTSLYEGKGYSGAFCENMTAVVTELRENPDVRLRLVTKPDIICARCPNHGAGDTCIQDNGPHAPRTDHMFNKNRVEDKDCLVAEAFGLKADGEYTYRELCNAALAALTPEFFAEICGTCEWHAQGLCRYEDLTARLAATVHADG